MKRLAIPFLLLALGLLPACRAVDAAALAQTRLGLSGEHALEGVAGLTSAVARTADAIARVASETVPAVQAAHDVIQGWADGVMTRRLVIILVILVAAGTLHGVLAARRTHRHLRELHRRNGTVS